MRRKLYDLINYVVRAALYGYFKKITIVGLENVPKNTPILFLPNHQNALLDVLLLVTSYTKAPYFLTRADVFSKKSLLNIFNFFRMIPVYRMRDGRNSISQNNKVFDQCASLLGQSKSVVIFPEGNHSLERRVRPLSKGFTRILFKYFEDYPDQDIQLVPVGFNYQEPTHFPDSVSVHYGEPISAKSLFIAHDKNTSVELLKEAVSKSLQNLTTHIPGDLDHASVNFVLYQQHCNFLNPNESNLKITEIKAGKLISDDSIVWKKERKLNILKAIFVVLNWPVVIFWTFFIIPKVKEPEFISTFRFATTLVLVPIYYIIIFLFFALTINIWYAIAVVSFSTILSLFYIKKGKN